MANRTASRFIACLLLAMETGCVVLPAAPPYFDPQYAPLQPEFSAPALPVRSAAYPPNYIECMRNRFRPDCPDAMAQATMDATPPTYQVPAPTPADPAPAGRAALGLAAIVLGTFAISFGVSRGMASMYRMPPISQWPRR